MGTRSILGRRCQALASVSGGKALPDEARLLELVQESHRVILRRDLAHTLGILHQRIGAGPVGAAALPGRDLVRRTEYRPLQVPAMRAYRLQRVQVCYCVWPPGHV